MRERDAPDRARGAAARLAPHEAGTRPHHRVTPTKDVDTSQMPANVRVRLREVAKDDIHPALPGRVEQALALAVGRSGQRLVVGEDRAVEVRAQALVRGDDVTER